MSIRKKWGLILFTIVSFSACLAPRLGLDSVSYDNISRQPTPKEVFIPIYDSKKEIPFEFLIIGEVIASPLRAERDFGHDPIELLKEQAREMGGIGLVEVASGSEHNSRHVWKGKVLVKKNK